MSIATADVGKVSVKNSSRNLIAGIHCLQVLDIIAAIYIDYFLEHDSIWTRIIEVTANENRVHVGSFEHINLFRSREEAPFMACAVTLKCSRHIHIAA
jgi:hypothetical protein